MESGRGPSACWVTPPKVPPPAGSSVVIVTESTRATMSRAPSTMAEMRPTQGCAVSGAVERLPRALAWPIAIPSTTSTTAGRSPASRPCVDDSERMTGPCHGSQRKTPQAAPTRTTTAIHGRNCCKRVIAAEGFPAAACRLLVGRREEARLLEPLGRPSNDGVAEPGAPGDVHQGRVAVARFSTQRRARSSSGVATAPPAER